MTHFQTLNREVCWILWLAFMYFNILFQIFPVMCNSEGELVSLQFVDQSYIWNNYTKAHVNQRKIIRRTVALPFYFSSFYPIGTVALPSYCILEDRFCQDLIVIYEMGKRSNIFEKLVFARTINLIFLMTCKVFQFLMVYSQARFDTSD